MATVIVKAEQAPTIKSIIKVFQNYRDGRHVLVEETHNVITDAGLGQILDLLGGLNTRSSTWFSWGSGATTDFAHTDADLLAECGSKTVGYINRTGSALTFACTISYSEGNTPGIVNEWKLFSAGNPNINTALVYLGNQAKTNNFELEIDDTIVLFNSGT